MKRTRAAAAAGAINLKQRCGQCKTCLNNIAGGWGGRVGGVELWWRLGRQSCFCWVFSFHSPAPFATPIPGCRPPPLRLPHAAHEGCGAVGPCWCTGTPLASAARQPATECFPAVPSSPPSPDLLCCSLPRTGGGQRRCRGGGPRGGVVGGRPDLLLWNSGPLRRSIYRVRGEAVGLVGVVMAVRMCGSWCLGLDGTPVQCMPGWQVRGRACVPSPPLDAFTHLLPPCCTPTPAGPQAHSVLR